MAAGGKTTLELIIAARDRTKGAFAKVGTQMRGLKASTGTLNGSLSSLKKGLGSAGASAMKLGTALGPLGLAAAAVAATIALISMGKAAVDSFAIFESGLADVRKTTGMTKAEIKALGVEIDNMATSIPVAHGELTKIAAIAGQLGIVGESNILGFTQTIAEMTVAFDMQAENAAIAIAKLCNIYDLPIEKASNLGSAINALGNTTAASEADIMAFSMALGPAAKLLGFAETEAIALGATMVGFGMDASNAGTRLSRAFSMIGQNLDELAGFMKVSTAQFTEDFENMPMETFMGVLEKLDGIEGKLEASTVGAKIFNEVGGKAIKSLVADLDGLNTNLATSKDNFAANTSLAEEFAAKTDTLQAKFDLFGNVVESFKIKIGAALAPLAGALTTGAMVAINGLGAAFDMLMKVAGPVLDIIFIKAKLLHAFFEGLAGPIIAAFSPLKGALDGIKTKFSGVSVVMKLFSDIITILTAGAKWLGKALGTLLAKAISPLVAKIQEGITVLTEFYNKLGPIKDIAGGVKEAFGKAFSGISEFADSLKESEPLIEELSETIVELKENAEDAGIAIAESFNTAADNLELAGGSYKTAIAGIEDEINTLKDAWNLAGEEEREAIDEQIRALEEVKNELLDGEKAAEAYHNTYINGAKDATKEQKEFTIQIGETTVTFKDQAAEVLNNVGAYEELQDSAQRLMDLDWSVFTEFEASLPKIDEGIGDMAEAFTGLKGVLESNIEELERVKESVMDISKIAAPFMEPGFLNGIKAIGSFAGSLSDAGSAINTFSNLQKVSVDGCINFSLHVRDMVSALEVLESQMEDLVPSFGNMDSLINDIADAFLYGGDKADVFISNFEDQMGAAHSTLEGAGFSFQDFSTIVENALDTGKLSMWNDEINRWQTITITGATDVANVIDGAIRSSGEAILAADPSKILDRWGRGFESNTGEIVKWGTISGRTFKEVSWDMRDYIMDTYGVRISVDAMYDLMKKPPEEQQKWLDDLMHSEEALTFQMDKQTNALKDQTTQLTKITNALQPYLEFMRTLNELAALSTLSTEKLNNGLNAINDTLVNLGTSLSTFDLRPAMEALFGTITTTDEGLKEFSGGAAASFTDTMAAYQTPLNALITYITRLSNAINGLTSAFDSLANISDSVLADQTKLTEVFEGIVKIMSNFSIKMGGAEGFADKFASGMASMLTSAAPLIKYFQDNNAAVELFNSTLNTFKATITNVVGTMNMMKEMSESILPSVDELEAGFERAEEAILHFQEALLKHIGLEITASIFDEEKFKNNVFTAITNFVADWNEATKGMSEDFKTFDAAASTITNLISSIMSLSNAFAEMKDITVLSSLEIEAALSKIPEILKEIDTFLGSSTWTEISTNVVAFAEKWSLVDEEISKAVGMFGSFVTVINNLISASTGVSTAVANMAEVVVVKSKDMAEAFKDIPKVMAEVAEYLGTESFTAIEDGLIKVNAAYETHKKTLDDVLPAFESAISTFSTLADGVLRLNETFLTLKDTTVATSREMGEAFYNIRLFTLRFTEALHNNLGDLVSVLIDLDIEWKIHAKKMDETLPSYESSTKGVSTLIGSLLSLTSALAALAEMGTVSEASFDKGFTSLIRSISNFSASLTTNVQPMITALQTLRAAWMENESVLQPLMVDFVTITRNFASMAINANIMTQAFKELSANSGSLEAGFEALIKFIKQVIEETQNFHTPKAAEEMAAFVEDVGDVIDAFRALDLSIAENTGKIERSISNSVSEIASTISSLKSLIPNMFVYGAGLMFSFISGINAWIPTLITQMQYIAGIIKSYLGVESPSELGPLQDLEKWPKNLVRTFSEGIKTEMGTLNASFSGMVVPMEGGGAGSGNRTNISMHITQNISDKKTALYATSELEKMLNRHEVM